MSGLIETRGYCTERSQKAFLWCGEMNHAFVSECIQLGHRNANADIKETVITQEYVTSRAQHETRVSIKIALRPAVKQEQTGGAT